MGRPKIAISHDRERGIPAAIAARMRFIHLAALITLAACADDPTPAEQELVTQRQKFEESTLADNYRFNWQRSCECTQETTRPMSIEVTNGAISNAWYRDGAHEEVPATVKEHLMTIEQIFDEIEESLGTAHMVNVQYDVELGFPTSVAIDYQQTVADEELSLLISNVGPNVQQ